MTADPQFSELLQYSTDPAAAELLPIEYCLEHLVAILGKVPADRHEPLTVGMVNTRNDEVLDQLAERLQRSVLPIQLNNYEIRQALSRIHGVATEDTGISVELRHTREIEFGAGQVASKLVDDLLSVAVRDGATDVHIERYQNDVDLRFRVDGFLHQVTTPLSPDNVRRVISRLKVLAELDPLERRKAQDGHFAALYTDGRNPRRIDFRVSVVPGRHGEDAVIRVLDPTSFRLDLAQLGFGDELLDRYQRLINYPNGLILISGPTLSGKTNTLYATIATLRKRNIKIVTVEDPIEYEFPKINQKPITQDMAFPDYIKAFLRQNPDVMLVGEVRDVATAETVIQAATTGHLVLSSVHTNDAISTIARLRTLDIPDDYIASTLLAVIGQRLVARVCEHCRVEYEPADELIELYYPAPPTHAFVRGKGCERCRDSGYAGLVGVFELLETTHELASAVARGDDLDMLRSLALQGDYAPLLDNARDLVARGVTTLEEVARRLSPGLRHNVPH